MRLRESLEFLQPITSEIRGRHGVHHPKRLVCPVIHVEHARLRIVRHHDKEQGTLRIVDPLLDMALGPTAECQDESVLLQAIEAQARRAWFVYLQDSVDDQFAVVHLILLLCGWVICRHRTVRSLNRMSGISCFRLVEGGSSSCLYIKMRAAGSDGRIRRQPLPAISLAPPGPSPYLLRRAISNLRA